MNKRQNKPAKIEDGYKTLTERDVERIKNLNLKHQWQIGLNDMKQMIYRHKKARMEHNIHAMECIEFRLSDCNFHRESFLMHRGMYQDITY